jgi:putative DNA primase/helicase
MSNQSLMAQLSQKNPFDAMILGNGGDPKPVLHNALLMLRNDDRWEGVLAFNEFTRQVVTLKPAPWQEEAGAAWTDTDDSRTANWLQGERVLVHTSIAAEAVRTVAKDNPFHPVREYLSGLKWDGKPRLNTWLT